MKMAKKLTVQEVVQRETANICVGCKHAIGSSRVYCGKLKEYVDGIAYCPHFELEPLEYKLYKRA